jgi:hypothetical protein
VNKNSAGTCIDGGVNDHYEKLTRDKSRDDDASEIPERLIGDAPDLITTSRYPDANAGESREKPKSRHLHAASAVLGFRKW